jgi:hypothetical protein
MSITAAFIFRLFVHQIVLQLLLLLCDMHTALVVVDTMTVLVATGLLSLSFASFHFVLGSPPQSDLSQSSSEIC